MVSTSWPRMDPSSTSAPPDAPPFWAEHALIPNPSEAARAHDPICPIETRSVVLITNSFRGRRARAQLLGAPSLIQSVMVWMSVVEMQGAREQPRGIKMLHLP